VAQLNEVSVACSRGNRARSWVQEVPRMHRTMRFLSLMVLISCGGKDGGESLGTGDAAMLDARIDGSDPDGSASDSSQTPDTGLQSVCAHPQCTNDPRGCLPNPVIENHCGCSMDAHCVNAGKGAWCDNPSFGGCSCRDESDCTQASWRHRCVTVLGGLLQVRCGCVSSDDCPASAPACDTSSQACT
jgi:hypothetical protein